MSEHDDLNANLPFILGVIVVSLAESVIATILGWSAIFGFPQGIRELRSVMSSNPTLEVVILIASALVGHFVGIACRNREGRWRLAIMVLTGVHLLTFGFHFVGAAGIQSV